MSGRERLASAILVLTLAIGVLATIFQSERVSGRIPEACDLRQQDDCVSTCAFVRLDVNVATAEELTALPGIGPKKADAIVDWRQANGPFADVDGLTAVKGIGPKTLSQIRQYICVTQGADETGD